jgi:hypothetical protein
MQNTFKTSIFAFTSEAELEPRSSFHDDPNLFRVLVSAGTLNITFEK